MRYALSHREPGQAIGLAAVGMIALVGLMAFAIDVGFFLEGRRELQLAADQAAEAAVVFLPDCSTAADGAKCASPNNAHDTAVQLLQNNGPIARQLCGHPSISADFSAPGAINSGATPGSDVTPGTYQSTSPLTAGTYYTLTVTIRCQPGFSFGRMIMGAAKEPLSASATAVVAPVTSTTCSAPIDVVAYSTGTAANQFGYPVGSGNIAGASPVQGFGLDTNFSTYPFDSGDILEICLAVSNGNCNSQDYVNWLAAKVCVPLNINSVQMLTASPGLSMGQLAQNNNSGMELRGYVKQGCPETACCPQPTAQVLYLPGSSEVQADPGLVWHVRPGAVNSLCLWQVSVVNYNDAQSCSGSCTVHISAFITIFIQDVRDNGNQKSLFHGVVVNPTSRSSITPSKVTRLIR